MTFVDTSVWIDYFNGKVSKKTNLLHNLLGVQRVAVGDLIVAEVLQGFKSKQDFQRAKQLFASLDFFNLGGWNLSLKSAENYRFLRSRGVTIRKTIDMFIGTFCIENNLPLLHSDRDFDPMEKHLGLKVL